MSELPDRKPRPIPPLASQLPADLSRVAAKGIIAMEAFLDLQGKAVEEAAFTRAHQFAKVGCVALGAAVRFLSLANNADRIALARSRQPKAA